MLSQFSNIATRIGRGAYSLAAAEIVSGAKISEFQLFRTKHLLHSFSSFPYGSYTTSPKRLQLTSMDASSSIVKGFSSEDTKLVMESSEDDLEAKKTASKIKKISDKKFKLPKRITEEEAKTVADEIFMDFSLHRANHHELFEYLKETTKTTGLNARQTQIIRDNFFFRTANTLLSAAMHAAKAVAQHDYKAVAKSARNIADEGGHGNPEGVHLQLLEDCFNNLAETVFGIEETTIPGSANSQHLTDAVRKFRALQKKMFRSSYSLMTGCLLAHEGAADEMLINFRKYCFEPYRGYYTEDEFEKLMEYFKAHRDDSKEGGNVEEQHKEQALEVAVDMISGDPKTANLIYEGGIKFLNAQAELWDEILSELKKSRYHGVPIPPKHDFLLEGTRPSVFTRSRETATTLDRSPEAEERF